MQNQLTVCNKICFISYTYSTMFCTKLNDLTIENDTLRSNKYGPVKKRLRNRYKLVHSKCSFALYTCLTDRINYYFLLFKHDRFPETHITTKTNNKQTEKNSRLILQTCDRLGQCQKHQTRYGMQHNRPSTLMTIQGLKSQRTNKCGHDN